MTQVLEDLLARPRLRLSGGVIWTFFLTFCARFA
jgi:hypothetical protein